jgi:hypothetical protein
MTRVEDRTRAAFDAITGLVGDPAPLPLPPPSTSTSTSLARGARAGWRSPSPRRGWGGWLVPAMAAMAVLAIGLTVAVVRVAPDGRGGRAATWTAPPAVPRYYVALPGNIYNAPYGAATAIVGDTYSGKRLAVLPAPAGLKFLTVTAAADDRTFVVGAARHPSQFGGPTSWYLLRLTPDVRRFATLRALSFPVPAHGSVNAMALSPDGTRLAMMGPENGPNLGTGNTMTTLRVYSVTGGTLLRAWSGVLPWRLANNTALSWTTDGRLAWSYLWDSDPRQDATIFAIRTLRPADPGHALVADSRTVWREEFFPGNGNPPFPLSCMGVETLTGDGSKLLCAAAAFLSPVFTAQHHPACPAGPPVNAEGFQLYSLTTRKLIRTVYVQHTQCYPLGPSLLWASPSGDVVLGEITYGIPKEKLTIFHFGIASNGRFWPLPTPPVVDGGYQAEGAAQIAW